MKRKLLAKSKSINHPYLLLTISLFFLSIFVGTLKLNQISITLSSNGNYYLLLILIVLLVLLLMIFQFKINVPKEGEKSTEQGKRRLSDDHGLINKVNDLIFQKLSDPTLSVSEIEKEIGVSRPILLSIFKKEKGATVVEFIKKERLKKARGLLESSSYNISEIAYQVGYSDPKYFSKSFRKEYSTTPTQYRNRYLKMNK